jgi:putative CocE/NonD family hydrolase
MKHRARLVALAAAVACVALSVPAAADEPTQDDIANHTGPSARSAVRPANVVAAGTTLTFDASASSSADGSPLRDWHWDFGDGTQADGAVATHRYLADGVYPTRVTVHDGFGDVGVSKQVVRVGQTYPAQVTEELRVPTRFGYTLHATVIRPQAPGAFPVVMEYGPYLNGAFSDTIETETVESGYVKVHVEAPGRGSSGGHFDLFGNETREAGYDAVEWAAVQPWSTGKVALIGYSGPAVGALTVAGSRPPHLAAVVARNSPTDIYRDLAYPGGARNANTFLDYWIPYFLQGQDTLYAGPTGTNDSALLSQRAQDNAALLADVHAHPTYDGWWRERNLSAFPVSAPVLYIGSQHDLWPRSSFEMYHWIHPAGGKVVMTPGQHSTPDQTGWESGGFTDGPARGWLDHYLKGVPNNIENAPPLLAYAGRGGDAAAQAIDTGRWVSLPDWPGNGVTYSSLFLNAEPQSGEPGFRSLSPAPPTSSTGTLPTAVVLSPAAGATTDNTPNYAKQANSLQEPDDAQALVFETPPLEQDLTVAGPVVVHLWSTLAAADLTFAVHVNDVWPDGSSNYISTGLLAASQASTLSTARSLYVGDELVRPYYGDDSPRDVDPGSLHDYAIEVWNVANVFGRGHRLRLTVAANNAVWRSSLTSGPAAVVYQDAAHPSRVVLPVVAPDVGRAAFPLTALADPATDVPETALTILLPLLAATGLGLVLLRRGQAAAAARATTSGR